MREVDENLNPLQDDVVRFLALDVGDEAHAAGVVLVAGIVQALRLREPRDTTRGVLSGMTVHVRPFTTSG
jgi:hypothetical protein